MKTHEMLEYDWATVVACLPDLEESSRETGALVRRRIVNSAELLLRLVLVYSLCDRSLRETSVWAETVGLARLSDVALLKRFRRCGPWLARLLIEKLRERSGQVDSFKSGLPIRLVDGTHLCRPGAKGTDLRIHLGINLNTLTTAGVTLSDATVGESFDRFDIIAGELLVADRGYARRDPMARVHQKGAFFLVRLPWSVVPLITDDGETFELFPFLRQIPPTKVCEASVRFQGSDGCVVPCRLIALRKSAAAAEISRQQVLAEASRKCRSVDPRSLEAAEYIILLTNLDSVRLSPHQVAELYRLRWQIEMTFKRFKSLLDLDRLHAFEPALVETYVFGKLLGALLVEDLTERYLSFSPWGFPLHPPTSIALAPIQDDA